MLSYLPEWRYMHRILSILCYFFFLICIFCWIFNPLSCLNSKDMLFEYPQTFCEKLILKFLFHRNTSRGLWPAISSIEILTKGHTAKAMRVVTRKKKGQPEVFLKIVVSWTNNTCSLKYLASYNIIIIFGQIFVFSNNSYIL